MSKEPLWTKILLKIENYEHYKSGKMLTGELKEITIEVINKFLKEHQKKKERAKDQIEKFMLRD